MSLTIPTIDQARPFYEGADSAHDFDHVLRVTALAERIARAEGADVNIVRAAALLHDIARAHEDHSGEVLDHAEVAAVRAEQLLLGWGASPDLARRAAQAIQSHRFRGSQQPESLEARVLFDADKLDAIGAIGVARAFAVAGSLNQKLFAPVPADAAATRNQHNSDHSPVAEFHVKLSHLRDRLYTPTARKLADGRDAFMREFFDRLACEVSGEL